MDKKTGFLTFADNDMYVRLAYLAGLSLRYAYNAELTVVVPKKYKVLEKYARVLRVVPVPFETVVPAW